MTGNSPSFEDFFEAATENEPFQYQSRLGNEGLPLRIEASTGSGKTAGAMLAWMYRRFVKKDAPLRLVWCAPMRTLVSQTASEVESWVARLEKAGMIGVDSVDVHVVMGGTDSQSWMMEPNRPAILIGTLDLLLSAAIGAPLGSSPRISAVGAGLLNYDCHWVYDEVQMFGVAGPTTLALHEIRKESESAGLSTCTWMSATLPDIVVPDSDQTDNVTVSPTEGDVEEDSSLGKRLHAAKTLHVKLGEMASADLIEKHRNKGDSVLVVVNTVASAQKLADELEGAVLLHSRFRPGDRTAAMDKAKDALANGGVVVSTQVIEAGVDVSADLLVTELCPWASLVQRSGRCNRFGTGRLGKVVVVGSETNVPYPYASAELERCEKVLLGLDGHSFSPFEAGKVEGPRLEALKHSGRIAGMVRGSLVASATGEEAHDILFIANSLIRKRDSYKVSVLWRAKAAEDGDGGPSRNELCSVPLNKLKELLARDKCERWVWCYESSSWVVPEGEIRVGSTVRLLQKAGGYTGDKGFDSVSTGKVDAAAWGDTGIKGRTIGKSVWLPLDVHLNDTRREAEAFGAGSEAESTIVSTAALFHDLGKVHRSFQQFLNSGDKPSPDAIRMWAKSGSAYGSLKPAKLNGLRHEVASFFSYCALSKKDEKLSLCPRIAYGILTHHGKVDMVNDQPPRTRPVRGQKTPAPVKFKGIYLEGGDVLIDEFAFGVGDDASHYYFSPCLTGAGIGEIWSGVGKKLWGEAAEFAKDFPLEACRIQALVRVADWRASDNPTLK